MKLRLDSFVYRINFGTVHPVCAPDTISACWLFWRTLLRLLFFVLFAICYYIIAVPIMFLFAQGPVNLFTYFTSCTIHDAPASEIAWIPTVDGHKVWPIVIIGLSFLVAIIGALAGSYVAFWVVVFSSLPFPEGFMTGINVVVSIFIAGILGIVTCVKCIPAAKKYFIQGVEKIKDSSAAELTVTTMRGWKQKYCPVVHVERPE